MPREKKYTRTVAFRVTAEEWELIEYVMQRDGINKPSAWIRDVLKDEFKNLHLSLVMANKRVEAAARRAAKKAQAANVDA